MSALARPHRATAAGTPVATPEAAEMTPYLWGLLTMLMGAALFEAFNLATISIVAPIVQDLYDLTNTEWGLVNLLIRVGAVTSFFFLMLADRVGRRPIMTISILGLAVFTGLTAWSRSVNEFTLYQVAARLFLAAAYAMSMIIMGEEFPTRHRGVGISMLAGIGALGTIIAFLSGRWVLAAFDWRAMFLLGLLPAGLAVFFQFGMRETRRFAALRTAGLAHTTLRQQFASMRVPFQRRYRARSLLVALVWNCTHMVVAPAITFWTIHAARNLGYGPQQYTVVVAGGYLFGFAVGAPFAGFCMNRFGRRITCAMFYFGAAAAVFALFQVVTPNLVVQTAIMSVTSACFLGATATTSTFATELFPTEIRATGYSWTTNLFGRITEILSPLAIGALADRIGIPWAVGVMAIGPVIGATIILLYAPETRGKTLEQISDELDHHAAARQQRRLA